MYEDIYSVQEVARRLNVTLPTVYQWIRKGRLHPVTVKTRNGSMYGIRDIDLCEFMKRNPRYRIYSLDEERELNAISRGSLSRLQETLDKLYAAKESLNGLNQDIENLERIIAEFES